MDNILTRKERGKCYGMNTNYKVVISDDALLDLRRYVEYLVRVKKNPQAASNLLDDYDETIESLRITAGSLKVCESPSMRQKSLRRINFLHHHFFLLYKVDGDTAYVTNIFHELEDADNKLQ